MLFLMLFNENGVIIVVISEDPCIDWFLNDLQMDFWRPIIVDSEENFVVQL
jgi:hypothetical protein